MRTGDERRRGLRTGGPWGELDPGHGGRTSAAAAMGDLEREGQREGPRLGEREGGRTRRPPIAPPSLEVAIRLLRCVFFFLEGESFGAFFFLEGEGERRVKAERKPIQTNIAE
jgi:hypothetical protein